jgi:hypothetical protein
MPRDEHRSEDGSIDLAEDRARAVDEAGRRAGAELRSPAPASGMAAIRGRVHRRRVVRGALSTAGVAVLFVAGAMAFTNGDSPDGVEPVDVPPVTNPDPNTPVSTVDPSTIETTKTDPSASLEPVDFVEAGTLSGLPWPRYSADSSVLAVESSDGTVVIHDAATLSPLSELPCPTSLETLPDSAGTDPDPDWVWDLGAAARWDAATSTVLTSVSYPPMCGVIMSADGRRAVTWADVQDASRDGRSLSERSLLWDTADGSLVAVIPGLLRGFSADGSRLVMSNGPSFSIVDGTSGAILDMVTDDAVGTAISPDGSRLMRWGSDTHPEGAGIATIYDTETLTPIARLSTGSQGEVVQIEDPVFDDTSGRIAALDASGLVIWNASTGEQLLHVDIELVDGRSVALFPGGAMIAVRNGSRITIIDTSSGAQLADLDVGPDIVEEVVFSADRASMAAGVTSGARVWSYTSTPAVTATPDDEQVPIETTNERPLSGEEIRVTSDLIEYGDDLVIPADSMVSGDGGLYVLAGQAFEEPRPFNQFMQTAVLVAFDDAGVERWRVQLDGRPTDVAVVDGDPWVLHLDDNSVSRISADDGRILGQVTLDAPVRDNMLFGAYGTVWVSVIRESRVDLADLVRIAPDLSTTTIELPSAPRIAGGSDAARGERIASGAGAVWVPLADAGVAMVDPDTNEVTVISGDAIGHGVGDVAVDGDVVYVASDTQVTSIVDRRVVATVSFPSIVYLGPLDGAFGVLVATAPESTSRSLLEDGPFQTLGPNDPMVIERGELSAGRRGGDCIEPLCSGTYGWDELDGEAWIESLAGPHWALERLRLLPASQTGD